jgi:hypothetical protein
MHDFDHILNWTLKQGSHPFPGPDGGTCINEAAIVAAGYPYQRVRRVGAMPECFSRPICRLAMQLNDEATDAQRPRLMPYVMRLACADAPGVEAERAAYIDTWTRVASTFDQRLAILDGALAIGRAADALPVEDAASRLDAVRRRPGALAGPLARLLKSWGWGKAAAKQPEPV